VASLSNPKFHEEKMNIQDQIKQDVTENKIMLYIKGEKQAPMCGFSATVLNVFNQLGVPYETKNVLADPELRDGIKSFTNWPTIPQIFVDGKFIGGCDITIEMYKTGELQQLVKQALGQ
jgi:monothiol glutaredoxin